MWVSMPELESILGREAAHALTRAGGGVRLHVPKNPEKARKLAAMIGETGARALCLEYGGLWITVPNGNRPEPHKNKVLDLLKKGVDKREIAQQCGVTERYVYALAKGAPAPKKKTRPDQWLLPIPG